MNEVIVSMNNISKSFPGVKALDHVSLSCVLEKSWRCLGKMEPENQP